MVITTLARALPDLVWLSFSGSLDSQDCSGRTAVLRPYSSLSRSIARERLSQTHAKAFYAQYCRPYHAPLQSTPVQPPTEFD
jgi:hypothetical protein